jgi:hypothetical protein
VDDLEARRGRYVVTGICSLAVAIRIAEEDE